MYSLFTLSVKQCILYLDKYCKGNKFSMFWGTYFSNKFRCKEDVLRKITQYKIGIVTHIQILILLPPTLGLDL
jgi:hypothetical protein